MNNIKHFREIAKITQVALGEACGWPNSQNRISNYETSIREPSLEDMRLIVKALNEAGAECAFDDVFPPEQESAA